MAHAGHRATATLAVTTVVAVAGCVINTGTIDGKANVRTGVTAVTQPAVAQGGDKAAQVAPTAVPTGSPGCEEAYFGPTGIGLPSQGAYVGVPLVKNMVGLSEAQVSEQIGLMLGSVTVVKGKPLTCFGEKFPEAVAVYRRLPPATIPPPSATPKPTSASASPVPTPCSTAPCASASATPTPDCSGASFDLKQAPPPTVGGPQHGAYKGQPLPRGYDELYNEVAVTMAIEKALQSAYGECFATRYPGATAIYRTKAQAGVVHCVPEAPTLVIPGQPVYIDVASPPIVSWTSSKTCGGIFYVKLMRADNQEVIWSGATTETSMLLLSNSRVEDRLRAEDLGPRLGVPVKIPYGHGELPVGVAFEWSVTLLADRALPSAQVGRLLPR